MRYTTPLLASLCLLLAGCVTTASQMEPAGPAPEPMKSANTIVVKTDDAPDDAYRRTAQLLQKQGYSFSNTDETLLSLTTEWKSYAGNNRMKVSAYVEEDDSASAKVTFKGTSRLGYNVGQAIAGEAAAEDAGSVVENRGQSGSPMQEAFTELNGLARSYPDGEVMYYRNP